MGDFDLTFIETADDKANTRGVVVTANSTVNTKGASELIASTSGASVVLRLTIIPEIANISNILIDIATGAAASEVDIIENIKYYADLGAAGDVLSTIDVYVPMPSGTRVSARCQAAVSSDTIELIATIYSGTFTYDGFTSDTFGADTSNSRGTIVPDPGGTADTLGAWTEIVGSSPNDITQLLLSFGNNGNLGFGANFDWIYEIGTGAASSEVVVHSGTFVGASASEQLFNVLEIIFAVIPSGTRIAIRCQCNNTNAVDRLLDVIAIGFNSSVTASGGGGGGIAQIVGQGGIVG